MHQPGAKGEYLYRCGLRRRRQHGKSGDHAKHTLKANHPPSPVGAESPMQISAPAINMEDVTLTLSSAAGPVNILAGITLKVAAGATVALLGPSGARTTSLRVVCARPRSGV